MPVIVVITHVLVAVVPEVELHAVDPVPQVRVEHFENVPRPDRMRGVVIREGLGMLLRVLLEEAEILLGVEHCLSRVVVQDVGGARQHPRCLVRPAGAVPAIRVPPRVVVAG